MACQECSRLIDELEISLRKLSSARIGMKAADESADITTYQNLRVLASDSRIDSELARMVLEKHRRVHSAAN